ncbi:MAG: diguanylate cyclase [Armatimonadota bacterium]|nr:diguanylate cyclase [Armatimonadota bacterium]MDR7426383.1 diguanylate cyclase [Armatimonadota bacterium]MDR7463955.1 diguanylate cyclase [Armatimonadota bacterium]MDR7469514.1 diguanylate cyclase [Armatimonadota bacterium]MDR7473478.1 diguanylate cyclase [Armatimonadota bacterium]
MPAARAQAASPPDLRIGTRAPRIMVVDDEPSVLEVVRLRLESMGATVIPLLQGADVLPVARAQNPDLILLDIMMPDLDGFAVIRALKEDEATRQIPVIFMTARDELDSRVQGLDLGAHDYVTKPFNTVELLARIRAALRVKALQDELTEKNKMLQQLATSDPLTGLPNRRTFDEQVFTEMERARRNAQPLSCLIFDIDDFKEINDIHGHQAGDEVLRQIGRVLTGRKRRTDLAARYGGEEFVWLLPGANQTAAVELGHWLLRTISELEVVTTQVPLRVTVSVGVSTYDPEVHGDVPTGALLQHADAALLEAKRAGKGRVVFRELNVLPDPMTEELGEPAEDQAGPLGPGQPFGVL